MIKITLTNQYFLYFMLQAHHCVSVLSFSTQFWHAEAIPRSPWPSALAELYTASAVVLVHLVIEPF